MIKVRHKGDFSKLTLYLDNVQKAVRNIDLDKYGQEGVEALKRATPKDTGLTASSWYYTVARTKDRIAINFNNTNRNGRVLIAIILQYGHPTRNGGWVEGIDYINPALRPIFNRLADEAWKGVTKL